MGIQFVGPIGRPLYILTQDVGYLMQRWAHQRKLTPPDPRFCYHLLSKLALAIQGAFASAGQDIDVQVIEHELLRRQMSQRVEEFSKRSSFIVSFDEVYVDAADYVYRPTRGVFWNGIEWEKNALQVAKYGYPTLAEQVDQVIEQWKKSGKSQVVVADDGVFEGASAQHFYALLEERGVGLVTLEESGQVICGLFLQSHFQPSQNGSRQIVVTAVHSYQPPQFNVHDWVCERDFFAGVPLSGRAYLHHRGETSAAALNEQELSVPYWEGCGSAEIWASIPREGAAEFTQRCVRLTNELFDHLARQSNRGPLTLGELPRLPVGVGFDHLKGQPGDLRQPYNDALQEFLHRTFGSSCKLQQAA